MQKEGIEGWLRGSNDFLYAVMKSPQHQERSPSKQEQEDDMVPSK
jgi:hypothetical protein